MDAEQRRMKRRLLEEQLRQLDEEERAQGASSSRLTALNTPATASGSYPPQWDVSLSKPLAPMASSASRHTPVHGVEHTSAGSSFAGGSSWEGQTRRYDQHQGYAHMPTLGPHGRHGQVQHQATKTNAIASSSRYPATTAPPPSLPLSPQGHAQTHMSAHSRYSAPLPTPQTATYSSPPSVPLPSAQQLHDWLRDHMAQSRGIDTVFTIQGRQVDMYTLLSAVIKAGGSTEVTSSGWWPHLAGILRLVDDHTPAPIRAGMGKQLQEFFLRLLGGLEILWERTKIAEDAANIRRDHDAAARDTMPTPTSVTHRPVSQISHGTRPYASDQQGTTATAPPSDRSANRGPQCASRPSSTSSTSALQFDRSAPASTNIATAGVPSTAGRGPILQSSHRNSHQPSSTLVTQSQRFSPDISAPVPLRPLNPAQPPQHRLPGYLTSRADHNRAMGSSPVQSASGEGAYNAADDQSQQRRSAATVQPQVTPIGPKFGKLTHLAFGGKPLGDYLVPRLQSFQELVSSDVLPLPNLDRETTDVAGPGVTDDLQYSKRCHELGHAVRHLQAGNPTRQISQEEIIFWAKLLAIMRNNPSVFPPPVQDSPRARHAEPTSLSEVASGAPGTFGNPVMIVAPARRVEEDTQTMHPVQPGLSQEKKKVGRPKGSKNRPKDANDEALPTEPVIKRPVGRPKGSKTKPKLPPQGPRPTFNLGASSQMGPGTARGEDALGDPLSVSQVATVGPVASQSIAEASQYALSVAQPDQAASQPVKKKRGRPKGSKTMFRRPGATVTSSAHVTDSDILVPASQPIGHFTMLDQLTESIRVSPSLVPTLAGSSTAVDTLAHALANQAAQAVQSGTDTSGTAKSRSEAQSLAMSTAVKERWQRFREAQGILYPLPKSKGKKKGSDFATEIAAPIPLIQDLSPRRRIDLSNGNTVAAHLRTNDTPTRIAKRSADVSVSPSPHLAKKLKSSRLSNGIVVADLAERAQSQPMADVQSVLAVIDPSYLNPEELAEPDVSELARALVRTMDASDPFTLAQAAETQAAPVKSVGQMQPKAKRGRPKLQKLAPATARRLASAAPGEPSVDLTTAKHNLPARAGTTTPIAPRSKGIPFIELPSSRQSNGFKIEDAEVVVTHSGRPASPNVSSRSTRGKRSLPAAMTSSQRSGRVLTDAPRRRGLQSQRVSLLHQNPSSRSHSDSEPRALSSIPPAHSSLQSARAPASQRGAGRKVAWAASTQVRRNTTPASITSLKSKTPLRPVDRLKVVLPIGRKRRATLIFRGTYNAFRDDDSEEEVIRLYRRHGTLRPTKVMTASGVRSSRPSEPEALPARFMIRPGPALSEPFAAILTEDSLLNRAIERECGWKGCDAVLGSEELLRRHVEVRQHALQGKEQVQTSRFVWGKLETSRTEPVPDQWMYRCFWAGCEEPCFRSEADLKQHMRARHIARVVYCPYQDCGLSSPTIYHLTRHVMKAHDSPTDRPCPLATVLIAAPRTKGPLRALPEMARTDELTTSRVLGSQHRTPFHIERVKLKVAAYCFAGDNPVIHVQHPPHMLQVIDSTLSDSEVDSDDDLLDSRVGWQKGKRYEPVVLIPAKRSRKGSLARSGSREEPMELDRTRSPAPEDEGTAVRSLDIDNSDSAVESENDDEAEIEGAMMAVPPTPAPFPVDPDADEEDEDPGDNPNDEAEIEGAIQAIPPTPAPFAVPVDSDTDEGYAESDRIPYDPQTPGYAEVEALMAADEDSGDEQPSGAHGLIQGEQDGQEFGASAAISPADFDYSIGLDDEEAGAKDEGESQVTESLTEARPLGELDADKSVVAGAVPIASDRVETILASVVATDIAPVDSITLRSEPTSASDVMESEPVSQDDAIALSTGQLPVLGEDVAGAHAHGDSPPQSAVPLPYPAQIEIDVGTSAEGLSQPEVRQHGPEALVTAEVMDEVQERSHSGIEAQAEVEGLASSPIELADAQVIDPGADDPLGIDVDTPSSDASVTLPEVTEAAINDASRSEDSVVVPLTSAVVDSPEIDQEPHSVMVHTIKPRAGGTEPADEESLNNVLGTGEAHESKPDGQADVATGTEARVESVIVVDVVGTEAVQGLKGD
ncbi:hypothetical protein IAU60_001460 [Kwoniella sp. DSM 27419]